MTTPAKREAKGMNDQYISEEELANLTGYKLKTLRNLRAEGRMPDAFKGPRGKVFYKKAEAVAWIEKLYMPITGR